MSSRKGDGVAAFAKASAVEHNELAARNDDGGHRKEDKNEEEAFASLDENWLIKNGTTQRPAKGESNAALLRRLTHLNLQDKKLVFVDNKSFKPCRGLVALSLFNNRLRELPNLTLQLLQKLYLQNNELSALPSFAGLPSLEKLFLQNNKIEVVSGLEQNYRLRELDVSGQRLPKNSAIVFGDLTIEALATSLVELRVGGNGVRSLSSLGLNNFMHLELLDCRNNKLDNLDDIQVYFSRSGQSLRSVTFMGNPVEKSKDYFRGLLLASSENMEIIDGKEIQAQQRMSLRRMYVKKMQRRNSKSGSTSFTSSTTTTSSSSKALAASASGLSVSSSRRNF